jgi:hypothetical protein
MSLLPPRIERPGLVGPLAPPMCPTMDAFALVLVVALNDAILRADRAEPIALGSLRPSGASGAELFHP